MASTGRAVTADLDHAATTRLRPEARAAMEPFLDDRYGNPSGAHALGRDAVRALDEARERIASLLGCAPGDVVVTSGGTEADNHAVTGGLPARPGVPVCGATEHHAVLDVVRVLGGRTVAVDALGRLDRDGLAAVLDDVTGSGVEVGVVSVMLANNELGTINDLRAVADVVDRHAPGVPVHTDAVQAAPWLDLSVHAAPASMVSISAHKFGGPKGVGVLVVRSGTTLRPLLHGGGQERNRRSGTVNVAGVVGLAAALEATVRDRDELSIRTAARRDRLARGLSARVDGLRETVVVDGDRSHLLPNLCHLMIDGVDPEALLFLIDDGGVRASSASSCASGAVERSQVVDALAATGVAVDGAALRLSLGWDTTDDEIDLALDVIPAAVARIRAHADTVDVRG
jgi:cysteine desulfurase